MYTIEDLKNGKCAVINDGTVVELNKVLSRVKWPFYASGTEKYYWRSSDRKVECDSTKPPIPTQSVKDFIKQLDKEENKSSEIKSLYKVGDVVTIKDKYDEGFGMSDYPGSFLIKMVKDYGNRKCKIKEVIESPYSCTLRAYVDPFTYKLEGAPWNWSAAMFKETPSSLFLCNKDKIKEEEKYEEEFTFSEDDIPSDFPYHPYVLDQGIQERCKQKHISPKEAFDYCIQYNIGTWLAWYNASQKYDYWEFIYCNPKFIPENYIPKYFKSRQSKLPLGGIPLCGVIDSEYQPSNLAKEKKDFMIPASYTEVELTIKKPICKF